MTDERALEIARRMRADGAAWYRIQRRVGRNEYWVRCRIEPGYREKRLAQRTALRSKKRTVPPKNRVVKRAEPDDAEVRARKAEIPKDTRDATARFFGDPIPGRSALDQMARVRHG